MLLKGNFTVKFIANNVELCEEYELPYRTEEKLYLCKGELNAFSMIYQSALLRIAQDLGFYFYKKKPGWREKDIMCKLGWKLYGIQIIDIQEINYLILEDKI